MTDYCYWCLRHWVFTSLVLYAFAAFLVSKHLLAAAIIIQGIAATFRGLREKTKKTEEDGPGQLQHHLEGGAA